MHLNEIGLCEVALSAPIAFDPYKVCKGTGSFIVIDRLSNVTIGAGMIVGLSDQEENRGRVTPEERHNRFGQKPQTIWLGAHRQDLAYDLERRLFNLGHAALVLEDTSLVPHVTLIAAQLHSAGLIGLCILEGHPPNLEDGHILAPAELATADNLLRWMSEQRILLT